MLKRTKLYDRRQHVRYRVQDGAVAVPRSTTVNIGRILDISSKGLSVRYQSEVDWLNGTTLIDIMLIDKDFYLAKLPAKIISDKNYTYYKAGKLRKEKRCGLQFTNLSDDQQAELTQFIHNHTIGKVWENLIFCVPRNVN